MKYMNYITAQLTEFYIQLLISYHIIVIGCTRNLFLSGEGTSHIYLLIFHTFHFCIYVKCNMYNNQPVRAYTDKSMYSSVISGRSEKSEDIQ